MDSTVIDSIKHFINKEDTLISKVNATIQNSTPDAFDRFLPLIAALAAVLLILGGQYLLKRYDEKKAIVAEKNITKSKIINLISLLKFHLHDLAYLEVEVVHLYYQYEVETMPLEKSALKNEYYKEYGFRTARKDKISQTVADLTSSFIHYFECQQKEVPDELSEAVKKMTNLIMNYKTMEFYKTTEELKAEKVRKDVGDLKRVYLSYIGQLESEAEML